MNGHQVLALKVAGKEQTRRVTDRRAEAAAQQQTKEQAKEQTEEKVEHRRNKRAKRQEKQEEAQRADVEAEKKLEGKENDRHKMEALESDDYFVVLGLQRGCSDADVRRAYRRLAVQWHPDKNRGHPKAEEYFKRVGEAYATLGDPAKRAAYEARGRAGLQPGADPGTAEFYADDESFGFGFGGHPGFSTRHARDIFEAFFRGSDPFAELFSGGLGESRGQRRRQASRPFGGGFGMDEGFGGFGFEPMLGVGFGGGGMASMTDSFFGDGFGADTGGFMSSSSFSSLGGGGTFSSASTSVSSSSFTDPSGHVVTIKTTTTVDASGRAETVTEEFRNGSLVNSTSSVTGGGSGLAGAGRMQLGRTSLPSSSMAAGASGSGGFQASRRRSSSSRSRPQY